MASRLSALVQSIRRDDAFMYALVVFLITRVVVFTWAALSDGLFEDSQSINAWYNSSSLLLQPWCKWDAQWYLRIASEGYSGYSFVFFPLYPLVIHALTYITRDPILSGILISNIAFFVAIYYLYKLINIRWSTGTARRVLLYLVLFPTAFFFAGIYTESLFLLWVILSFYCAEKKNYLGAGIFGFLASLTRLVGIVLFICFLYKYMAERKFSFTKIDANILCIILIPLGLVAYITYQYWAAGDPFIFMSAQATGPWSREVTIPLLPVVMAIVKLGTQNMPILFYVIDSVDIVFAIAFIEVLILGLKHIPLHYTLYMGGSLLIPLSTAMPDLPLRSFSRFAVVLFPAFILLATWIKNPRTSAALMISFALFQVFFISLFANWLWVA